MILTDEHIKRFHSISTHKTVYERIQKIKDMDIKVFLETIKRAEMMDWEDWEEGDGGYTQLLYDILAHNRELKIDDILNDSHNHKKS